MRDVGGIYLRGGRETIPGRVVRSGSPTALDARSARRLRAEFGILTYVDLRTEAEIDRDGVPTALLEAGVNWVHRPLTDPGDAVRGRPWPEPSDYARSYLETASHNANALGTILSEIAVADAPLAYGCTLGKDRAGIVTMLLLVACDAPARVIAREHALSARQLRSQGELVFRHAQRKNMSELAYVRRLEATQRAARLFLEAWHDGRGGRAALARLGFDDERVSELRSRLTRMSGATSHAQRLP